MIRIQLTEQQQKWVWISASGVGIILIIILGIYIFRRNETPATSSTVGSAQSSSTPASPTPVPTPVQAADVLTGQMVDASAATQPVMAVMIENLYPDARPQSGLGSAGIVYEALAEGGITRFMGLFQEPFPSTLGPIRSLRPYYLEWGLEYDIPVVHAGGSEPALAEVTTSGLKNIDALGYGTTYFYRSTDRVAPHNLYTTGTELAALDAKLGYATAPTFTPLSRKTDAPEKTPANPTINISFSSSEYAVQYTYDAVNNAYERFNGGAPQIDRNTNTQIEVKNVVVQFTGTTYGTQDDGKPETDIQDVGSGKALFFEDGGLTMGSWSKSSASAQTIFSDQNGDPIQFNIGNTWISVLPTGSAVTY